MTSEDIKNKIIKLKSDVGKLEEEKQKAIEEFNSKTSKLYKSINNLYDRLSLMNCRFKIYTEVKFRGKPAKIVNRYINEYTFKIYYTVEVDDAVWSEVYEDNPNLDDFDKTNTSKRKLQGKIKNV